MISILFFAEIFGFSAGFKLSRPEVIRLDESLQELECPVYRCNESVNNECFSMTENEYVLYTCQADHECAEFSLIEDKQPNATKSQNDSNCFEEVLTTTHKNSKFSEEYFKDSQSYSNELLNESADNDSNSSIDLCLENSTVIKECIEKASTDYEYTCTPYKIHNEDCDQDNLCDYKTLYCGENGKCVSKLAEGSFCNGIDECEPKKVCNLNTCIPWLSLKEGSLSDFSLACESGILLNGTCQPLELTDGNMPKLCKTHDDCTASDNFTKGICVCVYDDLGSSYCKPHRSDPVSIQHLIATNFESREASELATFVYNNFPILEKASQCFKESAVEFKTLKRLEENAEVCASFYFSLVSAVSGIVLGLF